VQNRAKFCTFLAPNFGIYIIKLAKFRGDRLTELGDIAVKKIKTLAVKYKTARY